jgi:general secretion pathway protein B
MAGPTVVPPIAPAPALKPSAPSLPAPVRAAKPAERPPELPASAAVPAAVAPSAAARVPLLAELPEALRRQLPPLALGGSMYSEQAERRLVIVNGQVAHEGDEPATGLTVRRIGLRSVVFEFRGQWFELGL